MQTAVSQPNRAYLWWLCNLQLLHDSCSRLVRWIVSIRCIETVLFYRFKQRGFAKRALHNSSLAFAKCVAKQWASPLKKSSYKCLAWRYSSSALFQKQPIEKFIFELSSILNEKWEHNWNDKNRNSAIEIRPKVAIWDQRRGSRVKISWRIWISFDLVRSCRNIDWRFD